MRANRMTGLLAAIWLAACAGDETTAPTVTATRGFTVTGIVRDEAERALSGAAVRLGDGALASTDAAGVFRITGLLGPQSLRVWKEAYEDFSRELTVSSDLFVEVVMKAIPYADSMVLGAVVRSNVFSDAPPCDPVRWDARAPCRKFVFTAPETGTLIVDVTWESDPPLDVTITNADGGYLGWSDEINTQHAVASAQVVRGEVYEVRVNSYYGKQAFNLRADLRGN